MWRTKLFKLFKKSSKVLANRIEDLLVIVDQIHLVDCHNDVADTE